MVSASLTRIASGQLWVYNLHVFNLYVFLIWFIYFFSYTHLFRVIITFFAAKCNKNLLAKSLAEAKRYFHFGGSKVNFSYKETVKKRGIVL